MTTKNSEDYPKDNARNKIEVGNEVVSIWSRGKGIRGIVENIKPDWGSQYGNLLIIKGRKFGWWSKRVLLAEVFDKKYTMKMKE